MRKYTALLNDKFCNVDDVWSSFHTNNFSQWLKNMPKIDPQTGEKKKWVESDLATRLPEDGIQQHKTDASSSETFIWMAIPYVCVPIP